MPTFDKIIDDVLKREGGSAVTNDPKDSGGRTQYGIAERSNPKAWTDGKVTEEEARDIYVEKYVIGPGYHRISPTHKKTQTLLIDFGVNSGPSIGTKKLQEIVEAEIDGVFGNETLAKMEAWDDRVLCNALAVARMKMICRLVQRRPKDVRFLGGWCERVLSFIS